ncbi:hypothetical protein [Mammaliicoccus sp. P-M59]|uniref:hypothetical protein n=1 Tax=Mammaliicoccus sp. P-M59 TaxID=2898718 RepID=UPI001EFA2C9B|nr:hypothetical protein [Mammaliicoccus sp. P-M59]
MAKIPGREVFEDISKEENGFKDIALTLEKIYQENFDHDIHDEVYRINVNRYVNELLIAYKKI